MTALEIAMAGYLAFGQPTGNYYEAITKHSGLQVMHADGAVTLRLEETGREESAEGCAKTVTIRMKDERYPLEVTRHVRTWGDCAAIETWAEIRHEEAGAVRLVRADSLAVLMYASETKDAAVLFALGLKIDGERTETFKLRGLDPDARYSFREINCGACRHASIIADAMAGRDLMERGLDVTLCGDYDSAVFELCRVSGN